MSSEKSFLMMFNDIESPTNIIYGANGTAMLSTSGEQQYDKFLDVFSSSTRIDSTKMDTSSFDKDSFLAKLQIFSHFTHPIYNYSPVFDVAS